MHIETFAAGPLGCNCSIVADLERKTAIVIDPGGELDELQRRLEAKGLRVEAIVHTHTHIDHVSGTASLQRYAGCAAQIHEADRFLYDIVPVQAALIGCATPEVCDVEGTLKDGLALSCGALQLGVLHTPGHTPGSVCFLLESAGKTQLFAGDTLFRRSVGRTDLWGGDASKLQRSIRDKLLTLPDDTLVITGHGPSTSIGEERIKNPHLAKVG